MQAVAKTGCGNQHRFFPAGGQFLGFRKTHYGIGGIVCNDALQVRVFEEKLPGEVIDIDLKMRFDVIEQGVPYFGVEAQQLDVILQQYFEIGRRAEQNHFL